MSRHVANRVPDKKVLIATLKHATQPMIVVEGPEDSTVYQWIERFADPEYSKESPKIQPAHGRKTLESIYKVYETDRESFPHAVVFIADSDEDLFTTGQPKGYDGIIWTAGYSIENDLYAGVNLENYLDPEEAREFKKILNSIIEWFTIAIQLRKTDKKTKIKVDLDELVPLGTTCVKAGFRHKELKPERELYKQIKKEYKLRIRGKLLFDLLTRFLSRNGRRPWHCRLGLFETACKIPQVHTYRDELIEAVQTKLNSEKAKISEVRTLMKPKKSRKRRRRFTPSF